MEKIYMENNDKKQSKVLQTLNSKLPHHLSALMMLVAFASFMGMVFGVGHNSYAIPEVESSLGESFVSKTGNLYQSSNGNYRIQRFYTTNDVPVFCLEHNVQFTSGVTYTKDSLITDYGLLHVMANSWPNKNFKEGMNENLQAWLTQTSIWWYLYEEELVVSGNVPETSVNYLTPEQISAIQNTTTIINPADTSETYSDGGNNLFTTYIKPLVDEAIKNRNVPNKNIEVSPANSNVTVSADEKYYISDKKVVTASPSSNFNSFDIEIKHAPEGTEILDSNNNVLSGDKLKNLPSGTEFYVRVPINNVKENAKNVDIAIVGSFRTLEGNYYRATGKQTVTSVKTINNNLVKDFNIDLTYTPDVPDTHMSVTQSVYFIGIVILLCGIGIIYANAKPKKSE